MEKIPLINLVLQYRSLKEEIDQAIGRVLESGQFILGPEVMHLEEEVAKFCGVSFAIACGSGTDGLYLSLLALNIKAGDEVITTPFTFVAAAEVISLLKARPVFVDIDPQTFNIRPEAISRAVTSRTKAIIPVHLYGQMAEMKEIMEIAKRYNLKIIEDAAQALGAAYHHQPAGSLGDLGVISFFPTKNLGAFGDGGMILTKDRELAERLKALRNHGSRQKYYHSLLGLNSRLDSLQAAILRIKLKYLTSWNERRKELAARYDRLLAEAVIIPYKSPDHEHIYHQYTIRLKERDRLKEFLSQNGVETAVHYPLSLSLQEAFHYLGYKKGDFPESELASQEVLSLPVYSELRPEQAERVVGLIKEFSQG